MPSLYIFCKKVYDIDVVLRFSTKLSIQRCITINTTSLLIHLSCTFMQKKNCQILFPAHSLHLTAFKVNRELFPTILNNWTTRKIFYLPFAILFYDPIMIHAWTNPKVLLDKNNCTTFLQFHSTTSIVHILRNAQ